ncbi:unnamed protein product [Calypogeia fissa]
MVVLKEHLRAAVGGDPPAKSVRRARPVAPHGRARETRGARARKCTEGGARRNTDGESRPGYPTRIGQRGVRPKIEVEKATFPGHSHERTPRKPEESTYSAGQNPNTGAPGQGGRGVG